MSKGTKKIETIEYPRVQLDGIRRLIFLDRYAIKDPNKAFQPGDTIVAVVDNSNPKYPRREVCKVIELLENGVKVETIDSQEEFVVPVNLTDRPLESSPSDMWDRMADGIVTVEKPELRQSLRDEFRWMLEDFRFSPGGRINAMLGTDQDLTAYNCYVIPIENLECKDPDSRQAIINTLGNQVEIMSRGGGVGINLSPLRPATAYVSGVNGRSSGAVSWGNLNSFVTDLVEQGGSRRGALMLILNDWHPDLLQFIYSKNKEEDIPGINETLKERFGQNVTVKAMGINHANISVGISNAFMEAVKNNLDWSLEFPDTTAVSKEVYANEWDGNLKRWKEKGYPTKVYATFSARDLWDCIMESAWASAEPGVVFLERANDESNAWYFEDLIATNPCGEQPLPGWGVCNLGHINLSRFVNGPVGKAEVDWDGIARTVRLGVRFLDNVIDYTGYFHEKNKEKQLSERRVGMGTMGLGEMLIRLGIRYGSDESVKFIDKLYSFIATEAYKASIDLAEEKGAFPLYDHDKFIQSGYMKRQFPLLPAEYQKKMASTGMRNVCITTQAPTGSTGTMVGTSTGIEPYYSWSYWRTGRLGPREIKERIVQDYFQEQGMDPESDLSNLPDFFVSAMDLSPADHIKVQAAVQKWTDSSISKTANCPNSFTVEQTKELYELAYDLGCKGVTIYRDGSREEQILSQSQTDEQEEAASKTAPIIHERPSLVPGFTEAIRFTEGTLYGTANFIPGNGPIEFFFNGGPKDSEVRSLLEYLGKVISVSVRRGVPVEKFIEQADEVAGGKPFFYKADFEKKGRNLSNAVSAIGLILQRALDYANVYNTNGVIPTSELADATNDQPKKGERCRECGAVGSIRREEGCLTCSACGSSKCV